LFIFIVPNFIEIFISNKTKTRLENDMLYHIDSTKLQVVQFIYSSLVLCSDIVLEYPHVLIVFLLSLSFFR